MKTLWDENETAPWALDPKKDNGRIYPYTTSVWRDSFSRDRDRILHSKAFRRLGYKTQVFTNSEGDNYRTRLTHSLEVGQLARSIGRALRLNVEACEALALAHDLGHTPFGHAGQNILHTLMKSHGGFEHNCQSLRIVNTLENRYPEHPGLNLTLVILKGMMKHAKVYECDTSLQTIANERKHENPALEAALVDLCDRIIYLHHDIEDGLDSGYIELDMLFEIPIWNEVWHALEQKSNSNFTSERKSVKIRTTIREMMGRFAEELILNIRERLTKLNGPDLTSLLTMPPAEYPVTHNVWAEKNIETIWNFLSSKLYRHPAVVQMSRRGSRVIKGLFDEYRETPSMLPWHFQNKIPLYGLERVVSDYISGMTDRYAAGEWTRIFNGKS